jgi:hypothetical protein
MQHLFQFPLMGKAKASIHPDNHVSGKMMKGPGMMLVSQDKMKNK